MHEEDEDAHSDGFSEEDNAELRREIEAHPENFHEIEIPDHGQNHEWFKAFLRSIGREGEYFGSIGGWLKEYSDTGDRYAWSEYRLERAARFLADQYPDDVD